MGGGLRPSRIPASCQPLTGAKIRLAPPDKLPYMLLSSAHVKDRAVRFLFGAADAATKGVFLAWPACLERIRNEITERQLD